MDVRLPDGRVLTGVPEGTTRAQIEAKIGASFDAPRRGAGASGSWQNIGGASGSWAEPSSAAERFGHRLADTGFGLAQTVMHTLNGAQKFPLITGDIDRRIQEREKQYQASKPEGLDIAGMAGTVAGAAPLAFIPVGQGGLVSRGLLGAVQGALSGAAQPVTTGSEGYADQKAAQIGTGAAIGGAFPLLSRVVKPNTAQQAKKLLDEGVELTPGQILGGSFKRAEDAATSIPILGDAVRSAQGRSLESFNEAALRRALGPVGETLPKGAIGRDGLAHVEKTLGDKYNALLPKLQFKPDQQFSAEFAQLQRMASQLPEAQAQQFERVIRDKLVNKMTPQGNMNGESFKAAESELNRIAEGYRKSADFDTRELGNALKSVVQSARSTLTRSNPQYADELAKINEGYANFSRLRRASGSVAAEDGVFTPAQLHNAVKAKSGGVDKSQFARGDALMQDLSEAGKSVLPSKVPDSGTMTRAAVAGLTLNPALIPAVMAGAAGYSAPAQLLARALLTKRPAAAGPLAEALPYVGAPTAALANQLLQSGAQ